MASVAVCRVCLGRNIKMYSIENKILQETFQLITNVNLNMEDGKPGTLCYICYSQLQKCCKFRDMSQTSEKLLTQIFGKGLALTTETVTMLDRSSPTLLSLAEIQHTSSDDSQNSCIIVKQQQVETSDYSTELEERCRYKVKTDEIRTTKTPNESQSILEMYLRGEIEERVTPNIEEVTSETSTGEMTVNYDIDNNDSTKETVDEGVTNDSSYPCGQLAESQPTKIQNKTLSILEMYLRNGKILEASKEKTTPNDSDGNAKEKQDEGVTNASRYPCEQCSKEFTLKCLLKRHMRTHTGENHYACVKCGKKYSCSFHAKSHMETHAGEKNNACKICGKSFFEWSNLMRHMKLHTDDKPITCEQCNKTFKDSDSLREHKKLHSGEKRHICDICGKAFARKSALMIHVRVHTGEKPFSCSKCEKKFTILRSLNKHILRIHTDVKPYACKICGKTFSEGECLKRHIRVHTGEKPFPCSKCGKKFTMLSDLNDHTHRVHTDVKAYTCEICGKTFSVTGYLKRHMRVHTGEKPYCCSLCDKSFPYYTNLKIHIVTHTGETPYSCDRCGKTFTQQTSLKQHIKMIHLNVRPYGCDVCGKTYSRRTHLQIHMRSHTGERPYNCEKCNKTFGRAERFKRHLEIHNRIATS